MFSSLALHVTSHGTQVSTTKMSKFSFLVSLINAGKNDAAAHAYAKPPSGTGGVLPDADPSRDELIIGNIKFKMFDLGCEQSRYPWGHGDSTTAEGVVYLVDAR